MRNAILLWEVPESEDRNFDSGWQEIRGFETGLKKWCRAEPIGQEAPQRLDGACRGEK